jgi:transcriptional regulator with XRE-family HTH domain
MTLKQWIKAEREAGRHWTQEKIAARLGVHAVTLNKMLTGKLEARVGVVRGVVALTGGKVGLTDWPTRERTA